MSNQTQTKAALVALLLGAALVGQQVSHRSGFAPSIVVGLTLFGVFNVIVSSPGTGVVRAIAVITTFAALLVPNPLLSVAVFLAWLLWPPAFMAAWALARRPNGGANADSHPDAAADRRARIGIAALIAAVAVSSIAYRLLVARGLQQTAALFVGIPAILAILVVFAVSPRSAIGVACKAVTVGLLVSLVFLGEGILCVLMSAPLFYAIAILIGSTMSWAHRRSEKSANTVFSSVIVLALLPLSLEGVTDSTTFNRDESVTVSKVVRASSQDVARALFEPPRFDRVRPLYLRSGFPSPVATRIERGADSTRWVIQLRGGEMRLNGMEPRTGDLVLELEQALPGVVRWRAVSDSSHMTHFLTWREIVIRWEPVDAGTTKVTWILRYRRGLDPSWYFGPMERYAVGLAAGYLIDSVATP